MLVPSKLLMGYKWAEVLNLRQADGALFSYVTMLIALVTVPGFGTLSNLMKGTS